MARARVRTEKQTGVQKKKQQQQIVTHLIKPSLNFSRSPSFSFSHFPKFTSIACVPAFVAACEDLPLVRPPGSSARD